LLVLVGVMEALNPVTSTIVPDVVENVFVFVVETTCRILPVLFRIGFPATVVIALVLMVLISLHISSIYYTTVQVAPELTVTVMPEFTVMGPILISL